MDQNRVDPSLQQQQSLARPCPTNLEHSSSHQNDNQQPQHQHQPSQHQQSQSSQSQLTQSTQQLQQTNPNFDSNVISERVKNLATQIYQELKRIISRCNYDEDILSGLMPLIVRVLESLDLALIDNQQLQVELELCKDDNEQLVVMFEKEKAAKRISDKKLIESEFAYEEERQQYQQKIDSLDGVVKMMELKAKNASDQATRLEEKENERKKEYQKLHDRYTELLKSHCDVVERVRHLVGNQEASSLSNIHVPHQMVASASSDINFSEVQSIHQLSNKMRQLRSEEHIPDSDSHRINNKSSRDALKSWNAESELIEDASLVVIEDVLGTGGHTKHSQQVSQQQQQQQASQSGDASSQNESDRLCPSDGLDGVETEKDGENDSIAYTSMEKEFRKLIQDNKDLLNTKNALNVVKDDLIAEVDRLTNEVSMYEQAVEQLNSTKEQMKQKVSLLDAELRKTKDELEKAKQKIRENNEEGVPYAQRKRFGRAEMAKVLMERNEYKEKFMELQDAIKYTELVRANKSESEKRSGLWKFFSNLFGAPQPLAIGSGQSTLSRSSSTLVSYHPDQASLSGAIGTLPGSSGHLMMGVNSNNANGAGELSFVSGVGGSGIVVGGNVNSSVGVGGIVVGGANQPIRSINQRLTSNSDLIVLMDTDLNMDRSRSSGTLGIVGLGPARDGTSRFMASSSEQQGYVHAYGWSLPVASFRNMSLASSLMAGNSLLADQDDQSGATMGLVRPIRATSGAGQPSSSLSLRIPIPQYCRPLTGDSQGMKIWCATTIDLSGGDTLGDMQFTNPELSTTNAGEQSSESIVNISNNSNLIKTPRKNLLLDDSTNAAINELEQEVDQALNESRASVSSSQQQQQQHLLGPVSSTPHPRNSRASLASKAAFASQVGDSELSSCVWICSTQHSRSKITVIDIKNKPNEMLDSFYVPTFLYCVKSIPGYKVYDLPGLLTNNLNGNSSSSSTITIEQQSQSDAKSPLMILIEELIATQKGKFYKLVKVNEQQASKALADRIEAKCNLMMRQSSANLNSTTTTMRSFVDQRQQQQQHHDSSLYGERSLEDEINSSQNVDATIENVDTTDIPKNDTNNSADYEDQVISRILDNNVCDGIAKLEKLNDFVAHTQEDIAASHSDSNIEAANESRRESQLQPERKLSGPHHHPISTHLPTVWMGGKDSILYVHSAIGQWGDLVDCVKLPDSILQIFHYRGRVFVALADGLLCVFFRDLQTKQWNLRNYLQIDINLLAEISACDISSNNDRDNSTQSSTNLKDNKREQQDDDDGASLSDQLRNAKEQKQREELQKKLAIANAKKLAAKTKVAGIRCIELANNNFWVGYRNRVLIMDPISLKLKHSIGVVPQLDNQVRQLVSMKDGVFCCLRSDLMLRLYSSLKPYQHIQNIDIEPVVTRLLSPRTFVISHITAMKVADNMVWIGIAHGIIITIPCTLETLVSETTSTASSSSNSGYTSNSLNPDNGQQRSPGFNVDGNQLTSCMSIAKSIPKCDIANAQISFHGHKDAVKFFIHTHRLMLSGGQGYLDFRLDMDDQSKSINDKSHLILWQMPEA